MESCKVLFVGNANTGKSAIAKHLRYGVKNEKPYTPTMGAEVGSYAPNEDIEEKARMYKIWDVAGNPRCVSVIQRYYVGASIAFVFEGGEGISPEEWEISVRLVSRRSKVYRVPKLGYGEKLNYVKSILC